MDESTIRLVGSAFFGVLIFLVSFFPQVERQLRSLLASNGKASPDSGIFVTLIKEIEDYQKQIAAWNARFEDTSTRMTALELDIKEERTARIEAERKAQEAQQQAEEKVREAQQTVDTLRGEVRQLHNIIRTLNTSLEEKVQEIDGLKQRGVEDRDRITSLENKIANLTTANQEANEARREAELRLQGMEMAIRLQSTSEKEAEPPEPGEASDQQADPDATPEISADSAQPAAGEET